CRMPSTISSSVILTAFVSRTAGRPSKSRGKLGHMMGLLPKVDKEECLASRPIDTLTGTCDNRPRARSLTRTLSMRRTLPAAFLSVLVAATVHAQAPKGQKAAKSAPKATSEQQRATADIQQFFRRVTQRLADADLADVKTLADWQAKRPRLREQMLEM